jgi:mannose/cellobiose epimerase-like protein (N-acyl-D-glucosamine 2-epimerase family)
MKLHFTIFLSLFASYTFGQYTIQSQYLQNPDLLIPYVEDCADFWIGAHDDVYGGFFVDINRMGNVTNDSYKTVVNNSRDAYGLTRAYMLTGNEAYLEKAASAITFMQDHLWDEVYGGWYNQCNRDGSSPSLGDKTAFDQHYGLLGLTAYFEATTNGTAMQYIENGFNFMDTYMWDTRPDYLGYYDVVSHTGSNPSGKTFNSTADAVTTHLYNLYLLTQDQEYFDRLMVMKANLQDHFVGSMDQQVIGFAEAYDSNWNIDPSEERTIMGHVLKTAWCLGRTHTIEADQSAIDDAYLLVDDVWNNGYDHEYGGPYKDYNRLTGEMYMYGANDIAKAWWQMEQAVTSGLLLFDITRGGRYLRMADESLDFFMEYFVDDTYNEVFADRSRTGGRVYYNGGYWDENKGSGWKAGYHSIETGYYAYLYGKLVLNDEPVTLYYKYQAADTARIIYMNPLATDFSQLEVTAVTKDDVAYTDFNGTNRTLNLPAGTSGTFAITYKYNNAGSVNIDEIAQNTAPFQVIGAYPNPFISQAKISLKVRQPGEISFSVYNTSGQLIESKVLNEKQGEKQISIDGNNLPEGLYIYKLSVDGYETTGKIMKQN